LQFAELICGPPIFASCCKERRVENFIMLVYTVKRYTEELKSNVPVLHWKKLEFFKNPLGLFDDIG
jgi:hypothetical protein